MGAFPLSSVETSDVPITRSRIAGLVPFLTDRRTQFVHPTLSSVETSFYSHLSEGGDSVTTEQFCVLLRDAATLLRPKKVVPLASSASETTHDDRLIPVDHPMATTLLVISDLHGLFLDRSGSDGRQRHVHVTSKLTFYGARVMASPLTLLRTIAAEAEARSAALTAGIGSTTGGSALESIRQSGHGSSGPTSKPRIEEIP
jgi:hypothetical protein